MASFLCRFFSLSILTASTCYSLETIEAPVLTNIQQVTFSSMGFEKAGEAYFSPNGKKIIFQAVPQGQKHYQIFVMNLEDRTFKMVSTGKGACTCPYFRPDGKKIIFASSHTSPLNNSQNVPGYKRENREYRWEFTPYMNIYEANLDGTDRVALTQGSAYHAECAYSSDGKSIVFASNESGSMNLYTMKSDGSSVQAITQSKHVYNGGPFFSPNSKKIIFRADYEKEHFLQIYCINSDSTSLTRLFSNEAVNWAPYWHPNGKVIVYTTSLHGHMRYEVYAMNVETKKHVRITYNPSFDGLAVFNRDGTKMMWTSKRSPDKTCQVFIADFSMPEEL